MFWTHQSSLTLCLYSLKWLETPSCNYSLFVLPCHLNSLGFTYFSFPSSFLPSLRWLTECSSVFPIVCVVNSVGNEKGKDVLLGRMRKWLIPTLDANSSLRTVVDSLMRSDQWKRKPWSQMLSGFPLAKCIGSNAQWNVVHWDIKFTSVFIPSLRR